MSINSHLVCESLHSYTHAKISENFACEIEYVTIYNPALELRSDTAFIVADAHLFPIHHTDQRSLLIVLGEVREHYINHVPHDVICVDKKYPLGVLYQQIQDSLNRYRGWEKTLTDLLLQNAGLNKMCCASVEFFGNPFTVQTGSFELIGIGENEEIRYPYKFREDNSEYLSEEWIVSAFKAPNRCFKTRGAFEFHYIEEHPSLLYNIYDGKKYRAQICVDANHRPITKGDYFRILIFAKYVYRFIKSVASDKVAFNTKLKYLLSNFVLNHADNQLALSAALKEIAWDNRSHFYCIVIRLDEGEVAQINKEYLCRHLETSMNKCIIFSDGDVIYGICNRQSGSTISEKDRERLLELGKKFSVTISISGYFEEFYECADFFKQCNAVLDIVVNKPTYTQDPKQCIYSFKDVALAYLTKHGADSLATTTLIPNSLKDLVRYDEENNTEYVKTLRAYLQSHLNVSTAATTLFIHRSTFKYRMQKIDSIMQIDYSNLEEILYLQTLFYLLDIN